MANKEIPNNAFWGVETALTINRAFYIAKEFYLPQEFSSLVISLEFYDPLEFGNYSDCDYRSSLVEVASLSGLKKAEKATLRRKIVKGLSFTSVSALSVIALVNANKPSLSGVVVAKEETAVTYAFEIHYKKATSLHLLYRDSKGEESEEIACPWDSSVPLAGLIRVKKLTGSFPFISGTYSLTIQASFGYGTMTLWSQKG